MWNLSRNSSFCQTIAEIRRKALLGWVACRHFLEQAWPRMSAADGISGQNNPT